MTKILALLSLILLSSLYLVIYDSDYAYAAKTGGYNFCEVFPAFPECGGWRTQALSDNYWFCEYVDLENFCNTPPTPEKQIPLKSANDCCRYIGSELKNIDDSDVSTGLLSSERLSMLQNTDQSIFPAIIWTNQDHYNFLDKVTIYGKFDFKNTSIENNLFDLDFAPTGMLVDNSTVVDIDLNGRRILKDLPVNQNGWFSAFYFLNDRYHFSNQNNLLEVEYTITSGVIPSSGPSTHATYHFTTGEISQKETGFEMWIDDSLLPNKIRYGITVESPERFINLDRYNFVITRLITPDGFVIPVASPFSIVDLSAEYDGFKEFGPGTYEIQITYGDNTLKKSFTY
jgi:hypothetical protein